MTVGRGRRSGRLEATWGAKAYVDIVLRLLRLAILVVLVLWILGLIVAIGRPETGGFEDAVLMAIVVGLFAVAVPVRRIGAPSP